MRPAAVHGRCRPSTRMRRTKKIVDAVLDSSGYANGGYSNQKAPVIVSDSGGLKLVAGTGFEPATFGL